MVFKSSFEAVLKLSEALLKIFGCYNFVAVLKAFRCCFNIAFKVIEALLKLLCGYVGEYLDDEDYNDNYDDDCSYSSCYSYLCSYSCLTVFYSPSWPFGLTAAPPTAS